MFTEQESYDKYEDSEESLIEKYKIVVLKGLNAEENYAFRLLAFNSLGTSDFTQTLHIQTPKPTYQHEKIPSIEHAQFNDIRESICFDLEPNAEFMLNNDINSFQNNQMLRDFTLKIQLKRNMFAADGSKRPTMNQRPAATNFNPFTYYSSFKNNQSNAFQTNVEKTSLPIHGVINETKTFLINSYRLKFGRNCISYSQLLAIDAHQRNTTLHNQLDNKNIDNEDEKNKRVYILVQNLKNQKETESEDSSLLKQSDNDITTHSEASFYLVLSTTALPILSNSSDSLLTTADYQTALFGRNFFDFKRYNDLFISVCYSEDLEVCQQKVNVSDKRGDLSTYITLIAVGCAAILIFIALLIGSICCCCCRRRIDKKKQQKLRQHLQTQQQLQNNHKKTVIKGFPIVTIQPKSKLFSFFRIKNQKKFKKTIYFLDFDFCESSMKSSQQHILKGNHETCSSNSSSSETNYLKNDKKYYGTKSNNSMDSTIYDQHQNKYSKFQEYNSI
jgi:hypothetical protein